MANHGNGTRAAISRRTFLSGSAGAAVGAALAGCATWAPSARVRNRGPNVVLIMTDDQGYGDLSCHGNPHLRTPHIDRLHAESVRLTQYHHCPVCTPTRASLMTGRYNYRTCAIDTFRGRAMMHPEEVTIAEMLHNAGYRTGIFGKWHLGDCYPMRACDQGFEESLVHRGGGIGQPSDPPGNPGYFDPILVHNGRLEPSKGYCTDIFTDAAIRFIESHRDEPFFVYLATNAPHVPLIVADSYAQPYRDMGLNEADAKVYGMIANIDENVGKVMAALDRLELTLNTILIFTTDNGAHFSPEDQRYTAGLRGTKASVYQGGIRVPCFIRWPNALEGGRDVDRIAAHIDLVPTLLAACGARKPREIELDGRNLLPLLAGRSRNWPDRNLYFQWHRGNTPEPYRNCAVRNQRFKLVDGVALYDLEADPGEQNDIATRYPEQVARMRADYERWFEDVSATRGYDPPRIVLGHPDANPVCLTLQDQRDGSEDGYGIGGFWAVYVVKEGTYDIVARFNNGTEAGTAEILVGGVRAKTELKPGETTCTFARVRLPCGPASLRAWVNAPKNGARYIDVVAA